VHSALGAASSDLAVRVERSTPMRLSRGALGADAPAEEIEEMFRELERAARERLSAQGAHREAQSLQRTVEVRFVRQTKALEIPWRGSATALLEDFLSVYARRYGVTAVPELAGFELVTFVVEGRGALRRPTLTRSSGGGSPPVSRGQREVYDPLAGRLIATPIYAGEALNAGDAVEGPAVIQYATTTLALCSGQRAEVNELLAVEIR
jgi:N-methylhydantoinase A